jgi:hypothetical protein
MARQSDRPTKRGLPTKRGIERPQLPVTAAFQTVEASTPSILWIKTHRRREHGRESKKRSIEQFEHPALPGVLVVQSGENQ